MSTDHAWDYSDDTWIHNLIHLQALQTAGKIQHIGLTNTDAAHLKLLVDSGFKIATNQVPCSVIDLRIQRGRLNDLCLENDVGLLCYSTLLGGFLSEKWVDQPEPSNIDELNWSLRKYLRFIWAAGGWAPFQGVLRSLQTIAQKHGVPIPAVATRYVLDIPSVKGVIVGSRLGANSEAHIASNLKAFAFSLDADDHKLIAKAQEALQDIPGDSGDEYRRPPFLTAAGDLSDHLKETDSVRQVREAVEKGQRVEYSSGSKWEPIAVSDHVGQATITLDTNLLQGYCRAVRVGNTIHVSGTTANSPVPELQNMGGSSAASQTVWILDIIENALKALGSCMKDVVRTRIMVEDLKYTEEVSRAHGWKFVNEGILPANTFGKFSSRSSMLQVQRRKRALYFQAQWLIKGTVTAHLAGETMLVEIEAWAEVGSGGKGVLRIKKH